MASEYVFTIKMDGETERTSPIAGESIASDKENLEKPMGNALSKSAIKKLVSYGTVKSFATQIINHEVSLVELRTGSRELQERASFNNQVAQKGLGIIEAMGAGAVVGGLPGAIIGTIVGFAHSIIGYGQAQNRINTARTVENVGLQMNNIRAGANGSRGR